MAPLRQFIGFISLSRFASHRLLVLVAILLYANTLTNSHTYVDDTLRDDKNVELGISGIPAIFSQYHSAWSDYQPVTLSLFALEESVFGGNTIISRMIQIGIFAALALVLFLVLDRLMPAIPEAIRLLAMLLFVLHPIHTTVVNSFLGRAEMLGLLFICMTMLFTSKFITARKWTSLIAVLVCFVLALLSNPESIVWLLVTVPFLIDLNNQKVRSLWIPAASISGVLLIYFLIRIPVSEPAVLYVLNPLIENDPVRIPTAFFTIGLYLKMLILPWPMLSTYGLGQIPMVDWASPWVYLSITAIFALVIGAIFFRRKMPALALGAAAILIGIVPFSNLFFLQEDIFNEKLLCGASFGFSLLLASFLGWIFKFRGQSLRDVYLSSTPFKWAFGLLIGGSVWLTVGRNFVWVNDYLLTSVDIEYAEESAFVNYQRGRFLRDEYLNYAVRNRLNHADSAAYYLDRSISIYDNWLPPIVELAEIELLDLDRPLVALELFAKAGELDSSNVAVKLGLAQVYANLGRAAEALEFYARVLEKEPLNELAINNMVELYFSIGHFDEAVYVNQRFFQLHPNSDIPYRLQGRILLAKGDTATAIEHFREALVLSPNDQLLPAQIEELTNPKPTEK